MVCTGQYIFKKKNSTKLKDCVIKHKCLVWAFKHCGKWFKGKQCINILSCIRVTLIQVKAIVWKCINLYQFINNKYILFYPANFREQTVHTFMCLARGVQHLCTSAFCFSNCGHHSILASLYNISEYCLRFKAGSKQATFIYIH